MSCQRPGPSHVSNRLISVLVIFQPDRRGLHVREQAWIVFVLAGFARKPRMHKGWSLPAKSFSDGQGGESSKVRDLSLL